MPENRPMPAPTELVNESIEFSQDLLEAAQNFARSKPWKGDLDLRIAKFREFHDAICGGSGPALMIDIDDVETNSGESRFNPEMNAIEINGKLSVVTYLFLYFMSVAFEDVQRGTFDGVEPMVKAMTLFKKVFPRSFARLRGENGIFVAGGLHRDHNLPVAAPSQAPALGTESDPQVLPPAPQVIDITSKPTRTDEEVGEL